METTVLRGRPATVTEQPETDAEVAESYGLDVDTFDTVQRRMWDDQQAFLGNYAKAGAVL